MTRGLSENYNAFSMGDRNPSSKPMYRCMAKGIRGGNEKLQRGFHWIVARRGILNVYEDRLELGPWHLCYSQFTNTMLYEVRQMFMRGYVLSFTCGDTPYQIGVNGNAFWRGDLPFAAARQSAAVRYSAFSMLIRLGVLSYLLYLLWMKFGK